MHISGLLFGVPGRLVALTRGRDFALLSIVQPLFSSANVGNAIGWRHVADDSLSDVMDY